MWGVIDVGGNVVSQTGLASVDERGWNAKSVTGGTWKMRRRHKFAIITVPSLLFLVYKFL